MNRVELLDAINAKKQEVIDLVNAEKLDEAKDAKAELQNMQDKFDLLDGMEQETTVEDKEVIPMNENKDVMKEFANAVRTRFMNMAKEGTDIDGGYTVPDDIQTKINEFREAHFSLVNLISVEGVSTDAGARTYRTKAQHSGFATVEEAAAIGETATPKFERIKYAIQKYAGYLPVTNELLADSDANISAEMIKWLGEESIATDNAHIIAKLKDSTFATAALTGLDDIKKVINVTLGSAYAGDVAIVTNDDGLNWLDSLKDSTGRELLRPVVDTTAPFKMQLAVGAHVIPVVAVPNAILASDTNKVPMFIGSLKDAVKKFDRKKLTIANSNTASVGSLNAFEQDLTVFRGIMRADYQIVDKDACVYGQVTLGE